MLSDPASHGDIVDLNEILRSVDAGYVKKKGFDRVLLLSDYYLLRDGFGSSSGSERRITEAIPKQTCSK